ncbi:death domain-containing protein [Parendozoicomonas sp. Alg238-R29]|uniref:death domain-containing protein n=1 Tax=Parendozoicomonas sp. Alg238-R29 TaxID=2993446 RepID=UPI00248F0BDE|nr:death domain-containing protein [Parendozoicomonas sp. Alg238-R29]
MFIKHTACVAYQWREFGAKIFDAKDMKLLDQINANCKTNQDAYFQMLNTWHEQYPDQRSMEVLVNALRTSDTQLNTAAMDIEQLGLERFLNGDTANPTGGTTMVGRPLPLVDQLCEQLRSVEIAPLGCKLLPESLMEEIEANYDGPEEKLRMVLDEWMHEDRMANLETLLAVLRSPSVGCVTEADHLDQTYKGQKYKAFSPPSPSTVPVEAYQKVLAQTQALAAQLEEERNKHRQELQRAEQLAHQWQEESLHLREELFNLKRKNIELALDQQSLNSAEQPPGKKAKSDDSEEQCQASSGGEPFVTQYEDIANQRPSHYALNLIFDITAEYWNEIGLSLGLSHEMLRIIKTDNPYSIRECVRVVYTKWLERDTHATYLKLMKAVQTIFLRFKKTEQEVHSFCQTLQAGERENMARSSKIKVTAQCMNNWLR